MALAYFCATAATEAAASTAAAAPPLSAQENIFEIVASGAKCHEKSFPTYTHTHTQKMEGNSPKYSSSHFPPIDLIKYIFVINQFELREQLKRQTIWSQSAKKKIKNQKPKPEQSNKTRHPTKETKGYLTKQKIVFIWAIAPSFSKKVKS